MNQSNRVFAGFTEGFGNARIGSVIGVDRTCETAFNNRLAKTDHIRAPVAGNDCVRAGADNLARVGCEVLDLADRVQFIADDFRLRHFLADVVNGGSRYCLAERVVLTDHIDFLDIAVLCHDISQRIHFYVSVCIKAEMPKITFVVGQCRINGRVI